MIPCGGSISNCFHRISAFFRLGIYGSVFGLLWAITQFLTIFTRGHFHPSMILLYLFEHDAISNRLHWNRPFFFRPPMSPFLAFHEQYIIHGFFAIFTRDRFHHSTIQLHPFDTWYYVGVPFLVISTETGHFIPHHRPDFDLPWAYMIFWPFHPSTISFHPFVHHAMSVCRF